MTSAAEPDSFTPEEIGLLEELAGNLAFGIVNLRMRAERQQAQQQLLASEQLFRALVENSPDFIARYDREYRRIYVNPSIQKLFEGFQQRDQLLCCPWRRSKFADTVELVFTHQSRILPGGREGDSLPGIKGQCMGGLRPSAQAGHSQ